MNEDAEWLEQEAEGEEEEDILEVQYQPLEDTDDDAPQDYGYTLLPQSNGMLSSDEDESELEIECGVVHLTLADREDDGQDAEKEKEEENNTPEVQPDTTFAALESDNIESIIDTSERRTATMKPHKEFSWDAPFPAHIDAESAKRLTEGALRNFDEKYRQEVSQGAASTTTERAERYPQLSSEYVEDIKTAMQGITLSMPPMDFEDDKWKEFLTERRKKD